MVKLHATISPRWDADPFVVRVATSPSRADEARSVEALLLPAAALERTPGFRAYLTFAPSSVGDPAPVVGLPDAFSYLQAGDVLRVSPRTGEVAVMYRRASRFNSIFTTERCNSNCLMCSQPPKDVDDGHIAAAFLEAVPLMDPATAELGITGGEPTLLGERLLELIRSCRDHLPNTALHVLSNGRLFNYISLCQSLAEIGHPHLMVGIPLYSDIAGLHDFVVQAKGAFDQTVRGIINLKRCGVGVEIRVVLHRQTVDRLPALARFIARNLPVVDHVALMGLEMMGYVKMNLDALWVDPADYQQQLVRAVRVLNAARMSVSVYNHQLCILDRELWPFARKSISDWKNEYLSVCEGCSVREQCGGFFASAKHRHSDYITPVAAENRVPTVQPDLLS
jgi:His-Xaa-Ser system radical SAM maturase HxsC